MYAVTDITPAIHRLFSDFESYLAVASMLRGSTPGRLLVDDLGCPRLGLAWFHSRVYLAGRAPGAAWEQEVLNVLNSELIPEFAAENRDAFILHSEPQGSINRLVGQLPDMRTIHTNRHHYCVDLPAPTRSILLPPEYRLQAVDEQLINDPEIDNKGWLFEEMLSERPSIDDFLARSFGVCLLHRCQIVGWCLSEYNGEGRCEVGVSTAEAHRQRGLGRMMSLALLETATEHGLQRVGWHCWATNLPSINLALSAGFRLESEYPVLVIIRDTPAS